MIEELITIAGTAGAVLAVVLPLQLRTGSRLDRLAEKVAHVAERVARIEGILTANRETPDLAPQ